MCLDHSLPLNQRSDIPPPAYYCNECADKVITTLWEGLYRNGGFRVLSVTAAKSFPSRPMFRFRGDI